MRLIQPTYTGLRLNLEGKTESRLFSPLGIEGNSLSLDQVRAISDNKKVIAPEKDILEARNAIKAYENIDSYNHTSLTSFCKAHGILMHGLVENAGKIRTGSVGIIKGSVVTHVAPPGDVVKSLVRELFDYLKKAKICCY